jgi:DNA-binding NarL/FixJ family response regulator
MQNILIADDHDLVRDTIAAFLEQGNEFKVVTADSLTQVIELGKGEIPFDVVILDYNMHGMNGLEGLDRARNAMPFTKIALMSGVATKSVGTDAMERGAVGFLPKSMSAKSLLNAVRFIASGERYFPFDFDKADSVGSGAARDISLTPRETETLEQLTLGLSNKEIARNLGIQEVTVKLHVKTLLAKLGAKNRTQAALIAKEKFLI